MGERLAGSQEVRGSNPLSSTKNSTEHVSPLPSFDGGTGACYFVAVGLPTEVTVWEGAR